MMLLEKNLRQQKNQLMKQIFHEMLLLDVVPNSDAGHHWDANYSLL